MNCSFCGLSTDGVRIIQGPAVHICSKCVALCNDILGTTKAGLEFEQEWIGVDLDGTLAEYHGWAGDSIGAPIPAMVERVKRWLADGHEVRIFTARASDDRIQSIRAVQQWCEKHIGQVLPVTNVKDYRMHELWDDRAVQVEPNTGHILGVPTRGLR